MTKKFSESALTNTYLSQRRMGRGISKARENTRNWYVGLWNFHSTDDKLSILDMKNLKKLIDKVSKKVEKEFF